MNLKIGELARASGLTIRTLRYYDAVGLLSPGQRTESAHRLYAHSDLARLLQIQSLKALGLSLGDIQGILDDPQQSPETIMQRHIRLGGAATHRPDPPAGPPQAPERLAAGQRRRTSRGD